MVKQKKDKNIYFKANKYLLIVFFLFILSFLFSNLFGIKLYLQEGFSMCPTYGEYGISLNKDIKHIDELKEGEVYSYLAYASFDYYSVKKGDKIEIIHRLIKIKNDTLIFKGDNSNLISEEITKNRVLDKVIVYIPLKSCKNI